MNTATRERKGALSHRHPRRRAAHRHGRYTGQRYTQHSTGVKDGQAGFIEFFDDFLGRNPDREIEIVRSFTDGDLVFLHVTQRLNGGEARWITMDILRADADGRMIEHWDVIAEWVDDTVSGHSQVDGPTTVTDLDRTEGNKALVRDFVQQVLTEGRAERIGDYVSSESYVQHNPLVGDGLEGLGTFSHDWLKRRVDALPRDPAPRRLRRHGGDTLARGPERHGDGGHGPVPRRRRPDRRTLGRDGAGPAG